MSDIEQIVLAFSGLPVATGDRWSVYALRPGRVYLSRDEHGRYSVFLIGTKDSFGGIPRIAGVEFSESIRAVPDDVTLQALRLTSPSVSFGNRVMAHVAYEIDRRIAGDEEISNEMLLSEVRWILELLVSSDSVLSEDLQKGLIGELFLLRRLLLLARELNVPCGKALNCWHGYDRAKRDFSGSNIAIEVKTTSGPTRVHHIGSIAQLDSHGDEDIYLMSIGVRLDKSAPRKLPEYVAEVSDLLVLADGTRDYDLVDRFERQLALYGYVTGLEGMYQASPGVLNFHLAPKLFREPELDRVRMASFKGDTLPSMVVNVAYDLDIRAPEVPAHDEKQIMIAMLTA